MSIANNQALRFEKEIVDSTVGLGEKFERITKFYVFFHLFFALLLLGEVFSFILFFSFWIQSSGVAFLIAFFLLTGFSYCVLFSYWQIKKPQQLCDLGRHFLDGYKEALSEREDLFLTHAIYRALSHLDSLQTEYYAVSFLGRTVNFLLRKFSVYCHWKDVFILKEFLLTEAILEHIAFVKKDPMDLEIHISLAKTYSKLAELYKEPESAQGREPLPWTPPDYASVSMQAKHKKFCQMAIEEYKIIDAYVPEDPWTHAQLANVYQEIGDFGKVIEEHETILKISPDDRVIMYHLGVLYFQQGQTSKGLQMYDRLKKLNDENAPHLIAHYTPKLGLAYSRFAI